MPLMPKIVHIYFIFVVHTVFLRWLTEHLYLFFFLLKKSLADFFHIGKWQHFSFFSIIAESTFHYGQMRFHKQQAIYKVQTSGIHPYYYLCHVKLDQSKFQICTIWIHYTIEPHIVWFWLIYSIKPNRTMWILTMWRLAVDTYTCHFWKPIFPMIQCQHRCLHNCGRLSVTIY